jgi:hypothetical protein
MRNVLKIGLSVLALGLPLHAYAQAPAEPVTALDADLIARLQPLRARHDSLAPQLLAIEKLMGKKRYPQACMQIAKLRVDLIHKAAPLFYQPDRRRGGDTEGVSHFLQTNVEGPKPLLEIIHEMFVPSQPMRALAVEACVRAKTPKEAVVFVADLAVLSNDPQARLTLALLRAQIAGRWQAGASAINQNVTGPRASLFRALAGQPPGAQPLVARAWQEAASPEEVGLTQQVAKLLNVAVPSLPPGRTQ